MSRIAFEPKHLLPWLGMADNTWLSADKKTTYTEMGGNLVIAQLAAPGGAALGSITVTGWSAMQGNKLGIELSDEPVEAPATTSTLAGDYKKKTNEANTAYEFDSIGNYQKDGQEANAPDLITGSAEAELIQGLGGDDALLGRGGDDVIEGGAGFDTSACKLRPRRFRRPQSRGCRPQIPQRAVGVRVANTAGLQ